MISSVIGKVSQNVLDFLRPHTEAESAPSQSLSQSLPPKDSCQPEDFTATHAKSDASFVASAPMRPTNSQVKQSLVDKYFSGTFDSEIVIPDDDNDDEDVQEVPAPKLNTRTTAGVRRSSKTAGLTQSSPRSRHSFSQEEQDSVEIHPFVSPRLLSPLLTGFQRSRPVTPNSRTAPLPVRRTTRTNMPSGRAPRNFTAAGKLRPFDNLSAAGPSSKQLHYNHQIRPSPPRASTKSDTSSKFAQPNGQPHKRQRLDDVEMRGATSSTNRTVSRSLKSDRNTIGSPASNLDLGNAYGMDDVVAATRPQGKTKPTPLRDIGELTSRNANEGRKRVPSSGHEKNPSMSSNDEEDVTHFMRDAREERRRRSNGSADDYARSSKSEFIKTSGLSSMKMKGRDFTDKSESSRPTRSKTSPRIPKMQQRLQLQSPESPDVLQLSHVNAVESTKQITSPSRTSPRSRPDVKRFALVRLVWDRILHAGDFELEVDEKKQSLSILCQSPTIGNDPLFTPIHVSKITRMIVPSDEDANVIMVICSGTGQGANKCLFDFKDSTKSLNDFVHLLVDTGSEIDVKHKESTWLARAMLAVPAERNEQQPQPTRHEQVGECPRKGLNFARPPIEPVGQQRIDHRRRVDYLDAGPTDQATREQGRAFAAAQDVTLHTDRRKQSSESRSAPDLPTERTRETRSKATKRPTEDAEFNTISIDVEPRRTGSEWKQPLIYPQTGKSRATVTWDDLERLNDDQFLNDNLVALFMRYLQQHMDQEQAKKVHFFSTFFYNSLTRPAERGKGKQINYSAVANWTKNVNLFHRDFVIVPVNEAAHWYVMIICNLRSLTEPPVMIEDEDTVEITGEIEEDVTNKDTERPILESDILMADDHVVDDDDYVENPNPTMTASTKKRSGRRKVQSRQRKYSLNQPIIITLDSLDQNRSGTASALKSYLVEEADDKLNKDIDKEDIKGMTAKNIPLQSNFSDCGLYLCMYLEQFARDPAAFVRSILQREDMRLSWPVKLQKGALRQRLYDMIQKLHNVQGTDKDPRLPSVGRLLLKHEDYERVKKTASGELYRADNVNDGLDFYDEQRQRPFTSRNKKESSADRILLNRVHTHIYQGSDCKQDQESTDTKEDSVRSIHFAVVIEDSQEPVQDHDATSSRYFEQHASQQQPISIGERPDTPIELAEKLRRARSPGPFTDQAQTARYANMHSTKVSPTKTVFTEDTEHPKTPLILGSTAVLTRSETHNHASEGHDVSNGYIQSYGRDHEVSDTAESFHGFSGEERGEQTRSRDTSVVSDSVRGHDDEMMV